MALDPSIISLIRDEIGDDLDYVNDDADLPGVPPAYDSLENIYTNGARGNYSPLNTALIVWRRRLGNHTMRAFDLAKEGNWYARSQRTKFLQFQVDKYERLTGQKYKGKNADITSEAEQQGLVADYTG
jgi:hypothetical protein